VSGIFVRDLRDLVRDLAQPGQLLDISNELNISESKAEQQAEPRSLNRLATTISLVGASSADLHVDISAAIAEFAITIVGEIERSAILTDLNPFTPKAPVPLARKANIEFGTQIVLSAQAGFRVLGSVSGVGLRGSINGFKALGGGINSARRVATSKTVQRCIFLALCLGRGDLARPEFIQ